MQAAIMLLKTKLKELKSKILKMLEINSENNECSGSTYSKHLGFPSAT